MVRGAFDGPTYNWGTSYFGKQFSGSGTGGGDYWLLVVKSIFAITRSVSWLAWRKNRFFVAGFAVANLWFRRCVV